MAGDPGAVEAGATQLTAMVEQFLGAGEGIRATGGAMSGAWTGAAAQAATAQITEIGSKASIGADVSRLVGQALTTYGTALRAAQALFARGEEMVGQGQALLTVASAHVTDLAAAPPGGGQQLDAAMNAAQGAVNAANAKVAEGQALMAQATQQELQANQAAATQVQGAQGQLAGMTAPVPGAGAGVAPGTGAPQATPAPAAAPTPPPEERGGFSWTDVAHTALDVAGLVPVVGEVADGANAAWYTAEGDYLNAGLSAAAMIPFAGWAATGLKAGIKAEKALKGATELAPDAAAAIKTAETPASGLRIAEAAPVKTPPGEAVLKGEPVDVGTGHLLLPAVDVELPGALPLVLERLHRSSYRSGRFFGPTWASTLDQHLLLTDDDVVLARLDGVALHFPTTGGAADEDPRWTLTLDATTAVVGHGDRRWHFAGAGDQRWLVAIVERDHRIDIDRLVDGTPLAIVHRSGYRVTVLVERDRIVGYDLVGAGPDGGDRALVRFGYEAGNLTAVVGSSGWPTRFGYDERGRMTGWADRVGTWFRHSYDDEDRVVRQVGSGGSLSCTFAYDDPVVARTDSLGHTTCWTHDDDGRVTRTVDPLGHERRTEYADGRAIAETDELGRTTRFGHDALGVLDRVVRPDGSEVVEEHDDAGRPLRVHDADGGVWSHRYVAGQRVSTTDPLGATTRYSHDATGLVAVVDAVGGVTRIENDAAGLPIAVTDPMGAVTRWERDPFGRVVAETDPTGIVTRYAWTLEGLLASVTAPDGGVERRCYDGEGNLTSLTSPTGAVTRFEYTHFDVVAARVEPDGSRFEQTWDSELRLVAVTSPDGLLWRYEYDAAGRLVAEADFDGRRRTYDLDAAGQLRARTNALGETTSYTFTALGQVSERRTQDALTTFDHDPVGRLVRATTPDVDVALTRDALGRVVGEATNGRSVSSSFDALGRRVERTTPTGLASQWSYAPDSTVSALMAGVEVRFTHDAAGRETRRRAGRAVVEQEWSSGRLVELRVGGLPGRAYRYRADGVLSGIGAREFSLDDRGRVTGVRAAGWSEEYAYDALGNTVGATWPGADLEVTGSRSYRGTVLVRAGRVSFSYDAEGRVVQRVRRRLSGRPETWHYEWNALDQLVAVTTPDGARWRYVYDAFGRRVSKVGPAEQVDFTWDGTTLVEEVRHSASGVVSTTWDHSGLRPVSQRSRWRAAGQSEIDECFFAIVTDLVGAPTELLSDDGSVAGQARRSLWGRTTWAGVSTPLLFPGQYLDDETGLAYNLHRYYDPDTARYVSQDPLGLAPSPNPAAYVHNPHTWADPLGLNPCGPQPPGGSGSSSGTSGAPPGPSAQKALPPGPERVNLASPERTQHVLHGDDYGGGHMVPAKPGKSEFPKHWNADQIMHNISDLATDPNARIVQQKGGNGSLYTKAGDPSTFEVYGTRDGVPIKVITEPAGRGIVTGYPIHQLR